MGRQSPGRPSTSPRSSSSRSGAHEVGRDAADRAGPFLHALVRLERADARPPCGGIQLHLVAHAQAVPGQRARHHGAGALDGEDPVDEEPRARDLGRRSGPEHRVERRFQRVDPLAGAGGDRDDGRVRKGRPAQSRADVLLGGAQGLGVHQVAFRERDDAAGDPEDVEDLQVLLGLPSPPLVGRDDEEDQADRPHAGQHVADEALVARHVHEAHLAPGRERAPRVAQVDREATALLLDEAVGVDARQRCNERGLAVIDVAGGGHHVDPAGVARHTDPAGVARHATSPDTPQSSIRSSPSSA